MDATTRNRLDTTDDDRSIGSLLRDLRDETTLLLRQEVALAKTELSDKSARYGRNAGYLAAGGVVAFAGVIFLLIALTVGLYALLVVAGVGHMVSGWLAPLIVGAVVTAIGYSLVQKAITTFRHESPVPEKTKESLQENTRWLQHKVS